MKRRSNVAPIRPCELFSESQLASAATKKAVVPRQLDFSRNPSRTSITGKPQNFRASINVSHQPRIRLSGIMKQDVSVMDGISLLSQTISENPDDVTVQIPKQDVASISSIPVQLSCATQSVNKCDNRKPTNLPLKPETSAPKRLSSSSLSSSSSSTVNETKIPKPKIRTTEKTTRADKKKTAELNSTAAFEGEEIAALTSTPHPERKSKSVVPSSSSAAENSELADQMKLFIMDQRSVMQAVKLSFQKMNSVMDRMNTLLEKLNVEVDSQAELMLVKKSGTLLGVAEGNAGSAVQSNLALNDDKENVHVNGQSIQKSLSMFCDMKSQLNCLKTPTAFRTRPLSAETPNTILSNVVHNQLENLYETNETDD